MPLDQVANFISVDVQGGHTSGDSVIQLQPGEASRLPDISNGKYNLVWFDDDNFRRPDKDPNAEIVRVNNINTSNDTVSVTRGVENTTPTSKNATEGKYELLLGVTAKTITDIDTQKLDESAYSPESDTHSKTTSASELTDVSADSVSSAHHSKTSSASELTDVSADSVSSAHHSKTSSASELTDVSPDSVSGAHHNKYTDSDTINAIDGQIITPSQSIHSNSVDSEINLSSDQGLILTGPITGDEKISGEGRLVVRGDTLSKTRDASELIDVSPDSISNAHHDKYTDEEAQDAVGSMLNDGLEYDDANNLVNILAGNSLTIDENGNIKVVESSISHDNISNISSSDHHSKTTSASELTDVSADSVSSAHHSKTSSASELTDVSPDSAPDAHHSKTSSASEITDVSPDSVSGAHHNRIQLSNSTVPVVTQPTDINFTNDIEVFDNGDGTVSVSSTALSTSEKGAADGVAELDSSSKILSSQLPSLTITETDVVADKTERLALDAEKGDVAIQQDKNQSYILKGTDATLDSEWAVLQSPTSDLTSVFGRTGDVTAQSNDYTHDQIGGQASDDHHSRYTDSEAVSAITNQDIDADTLDGKNSTDFVETTDNIDADTLDGKNSTDFVETGDSINADSFQTKNFEIVENSSTESIEFNYTG